MEQLSTTRLSELVQRKLHLLVVLKEMTLQQIELIDRDDVDQLLSLLSKKDEAMQGLQLVQQQLAPFQEQDAQDRVWASDDDRLHCRQAFEKCERLIAELIMMENTAVNRLSHERELVGSQLRVMQSTAEMNRAYAVNSDASVEEVSFLSIEG